MASETSALATAELRHSRHELHRRLSDDQQHWLADLYRANASAVYFICHFLLRRPEDAADATQEVFLKAVESLRGRSTSRLARSWLLTAAQDHCLDVLRRHSQVDKTAVIPGADAGAEADPESAVVERALITAVLGELRVRERRAILMWAVERRPLAEIARELGLSYTAVQQLLFRARRHAALVATRVAALLGLFQFGRVVRRATQAVQVVLVAAAVPVLLVAVPSTSTAHPTSGAPAAHPAVLARAPAVVVIGVRGPQTLRTEVAQPFTPPLQVPPAPVSLAPASLDVVTSRANSAISYLRRSTGQLSSLPISPNPGGPQLP